MKIKSIHFAVNATNLKTGETLYIDDFQLFEVKTHASLDLNDGECNEYIP
jgi:hypothetical protein